MVGGEFIGTLQAYIVLWILAGMLGYAEAGLFAACMAVTNLSNPVMIGLAGYFSPHLAKAFADNGNQALSRQSLMATAIMGVFMVVFVLIFMPIPLRMG